MGDDLTDLDFAILGTIPMEGSKLGNHTYAKQVRTISEELGDATSGQINGRLRSMKAKGLVTSVVMQPAAHGRGWQRTAKAASALGGRRMERQSLARMGSGRLRVV
jgi:hypothetical protein